jgi:hypothetical protein
MPDDPVLATHYRKQASRLLALAACVPSAELKAGLHTAARMYEGFAEELEKPARLTAGIGVEIHGGCALMPRTTIPRSTGH